MQQAALMTFSRGNAEKASATGTEVLVLRAQNQLQTLDMQSKLYLNIQLRRIQKVIWTESSISALKSVGTASHCIKGALLELHTLLYQQGRAVAAPGLWVKGWEGCRGTRYHPGARAERLEAAVCPQMAVLIQILPPSAPVRLFTASVHILSLSLL